MKPGAALAIFDHLMSRPATLEERAEYERDVAANPLQSIGDDPAHAPRAAINSNVGVQWAHEEHQEAQAEANQLVLALRLQLGITVANGIRRVLGFIFVMLIAGKAEAVCAPRDTNDINSPREYLSALLDASVVLKSAVHRSIEFQKTNSAMDGIALFENARQEYDCAKSYVEPYVKSSNHAVVASAQSYAVAITKLHDVSEAARQQFKDLLDGKAEKPSEQAEHAGQLEVQGQDAWHFENNAVVASCIALVEFGPDKKQAGLILTKDERAAFIARIRKAFGNPSSNATVPPLDSSMILLRDILADEKARPSHDNAH